MNSKKLYGNTAWGLLVSLLLATVAYGAPPEARERAKPFKGSSTLFRVGTFPSGGGTGVCGYDEQPGQGVLGTSGEGQSTLLGRFTINVDLIVDLTGLVTGDGPSDGLVIIPILDSCGELIAANGDKVFLDFGAWDSVWDEDCGCRLGTIGVEVTGGTGRFEGATGTIPFITKVFPNGPGSDDDLIVAEHDGRITVIVPAAATNPRGN